MIANTMAVRWSLVRPFRTPSRTTLRHLLSSRPSTLYRKAKLTSSLIIRRKLPCPPPLPTRIPTSSSVPHLPRTRHSLPPKHLPRRPPLHLDPAPAGGGRDRLRGRFREVVASPITRDDPVKHNKPLPLAQRRESSKCGGREDV